MINQIFTKKSKNMGGVKTSLFFIYLIFVISFFISCASTFKIASNKSHLKKAREIEDYFETGSNRVKITLNEKSGNSVYMLVFLNSQARHGHSNEYKLLGAILPENSSTIVLGEIFSYNLARVLGFEKYYGPGVHFVLKGEGLKKFRSMILKARYNEAKEINRKNLLKQTKRANKLNCVYKKWGSKPYDLNKLVRNNSLNPQNIMANYITAKNKKPGSEMIELADLRQGPGNGKGIAIDLARQLSVIMLIDILTGQWDRFSGGNLQATVQNGKISLAAFDNGGTFCYNDGARLFKRYISIVSRFDKDIVKRLVKMNNFLNKKTIKSFLIYKSEEEFRNDMGIIQGPDNLSKADWVWKMFKINLSKLIKHIKNTEVHYGIDKCYF